MENILLTPDEQKVVLKFKRILERDFGVVICLPENVSSCSRDIVFATVFGENIHLVKNFIQRRMNERKQRHEQRIAVQNDVTTITLSDSDSDSSFPVLKEIQEKGKRKKRSKDNAFIKKAKLDDTVDLSSTILIEDSDESTDEDCAQEKSNAKKENTVNLHEMDGKTNSSTQVNIESLLASADFTPLINAQINEHTAKDEPIILRDSPPPDFISLCSGKAKKNIPNEMDDIVIIIEDETPKPFVAKPKCLIPIGTDGSNAALSIPRPIVARPRSLRPVVIDGSNVAREHGKVNNTYSCKGIQIAINHFLERGHEQVTAFVPQFRRHQKFGKVVPTDQHLLEELSTNQRVVFTPSRRINNKSVASYDDRFIVELATKTGGVILSNDNFRDIAAESEEFRKTVHERLLMFCFVGDIIMIPQDPLGRNGPSLDDFLSFPD